MNATDRNRTETASGLARPSSDGNSLWSLLFAAWFVALVASLGALFIGEVMGQTPCVLCWYQRAFMFPLAIVLAVGAFRVDRGTWLYGLPLAVIGGGIALYHSLLFGGVITEALEPCGQGPSCTDAAMTIFGSIPLPFLSFAAFAGIVLLLFLTTRIRKP
ncbi:disulfide bond formation protein B [Aquibium oceanicum]|uniref:Disulfide bond formation protein B n=1 Tax=Aquibium oceanicum TaxID=1670800 RepID=A0A1L3T012_9HYPH|nr:disulfide bond formation protein B [Aquibium oceanicum]APH74954.1 disulfide bond formation protein B [Aquibium oceanicum]